MNLRNDSWAKLDPALPGFQELALARHDCSNAPGQRHPVHASVSIPEPCRNNRSLRPLLGLRASKIVN